MTFDALVIGKGPAGISAAIYLLRAGFTVGVIAADHGALARAERIENYYGFVDPVGGKELAERGEAQAKRLGAVFFDDEAVNASFRSSFVVRTKGEEHDAKVVVLATGATRKKPKIDNLERFEGAGVSYCAVCDAFFFRGKKVAVLGSGEYAKNEADELFPFATVTILTNGETPTTDFSDYEVLDKKIVGLYGDFVLEGVTFADGTKDSFDGLFVAVGRAGTADLAKKLGAVVQNGEVLVDETGATTVPGVYAAGDCVPGIKQVSKAVSDGMTAAMSAIRFLRNENR